MSDEKNNLMSIGVDINLTAASACYLCLAIVTPIIIYFISKKYIV